MSRVTIYEDEDFRVQGEVMEDLFYMHVDVSNYNRSVRKKMNSVWSDIQEEVWMNGWEHIFSYNTNSKFAKMFGWEEVAIATVSMPMRTPPQHRLL